MAEQKTVRVALIGYGLAGAVFHAPLIAATEGLALTAIVTRDAMRKEQASKDFPHARLLGSAHAIWDDSSSYDHVVVAAPNKVHVSLGEASLKAGIPVVIDKPFATTVSEARKLIELSKSTVTMLTVFQNRRWDNDFLTVQKLLVEDLLGQITRFESRMDRYRPAPRPGSWRESVAVEEGGGLLFDLGSHLIDQALALFGHPKSLYAEVDTRRPASTVDDDTFIALQFGSGVRAHLWMSYVARSAGPRFRVMGLRGTYEKWGVDPQEEALRSGRRPPELDWGREKEENWGRLHSDIDGAEFDAAWESLPGDYPRFYALGREAILNGSPPPGEHPPPYLLAECNLLVASNLLEQKKFKEARSYFDKTLKLYRCYKTKPGMVGDVLKKLEDYLKESQTLGDKGSYSAMQKDVESPREQWLIR